MKIRIGKLTDAFLSSYTKDGYISFWANEAAKMQQVLLLKGASVKIRSKLYKFLAHLLAEEGYDVELIHQAQNLNFLEGIILKKERLMIADYMEDIAAENTKIFLLSDYFNEEIYEIYEAKIRDLEEEISVNAEILGENCRYIDWRRPIFRDTDEKNRRLFIEKLADNYFFPNKVKPHIRFAGGFDARKKDDYYREILFGVRRKIYLALVCEPSMILQELAEQAGRAGFESTLYFNNWHSEQAELLVVPTLSLAIAAEKMAADFVPCSANEEYPTEFDSLPGDIRGLLSTINEQQKKLDEIYSDILSEDCLVNAKEKLKSILDDFLSAT